MLTKTNRFVRVLALVMASLMVIAMCLTGCTDSDAQQAAKDAQATADAAKAAADAAKAAADAAKSAADTKTTSEAVAEQIKNALKDYLKTNDAITEAKVNELVNAATKDLAKTSDLSAYAKSSKVDELASKLSGYAKVGDSYGKSDVYTKAEADKAIKDQIAELINKTLCNYALKSELEGLMKSSDGLTLEDVKKVVNDTLKGFYTNAEIDKKFADLANVYLKQADFEKKMGEYFGTMQPAEVAIALEGAMQLEDWNNATTVVLATIQNIQNLIKKIESIGTTDVYTNDAKEKIAEKLSPVLGYAPMIDEEGKLILDENDTPVVDKNKPISVVDAEGNPDPNAIKMLEYRFLRVATIDEMKTLNAAIEDAMTVPSFTDEYNEIIVKLYALGENIVYGTYDAAGKFVPAKAAADGKYHNTAYKKGDALKTQMVTIADKAAFNAINEELDALLVKYVKDNAFATSVEYPTFKNLKVTYYYADQKLKKDGDKVVNDGAATVAYGDKVPADTATNKYTLLYTTATQNSMSGKMWKEIDATGAYADANAVYYIPANVNGAQLFGYDLAPSAYSKVKNDYKTKTSETYQKYATDLNGGIYSDTTFGGVAGEYDKAYGAIVLMLQDCKAMIDAAKTEFVTNFLSNEAFDGCKKDDDYIKALTAALCEPKDEDAAIKGGLFLDGGLFGDKTKYPKVEVIKWMNEAVMINALEVNDDSGNNDATVAKYSVYVKMMNKAYQLLFAKYRELALNAYDVLLNDYLSIVEYAQNPALDVEGMKLALGHIDYSHFSNDGENLTFVNAFVGGGNFDREMSTNKYSKYLDDKFYMDYFDQFNNVALVKNDKVAAPVAINTLATIAQNAKLIKLQLGAATTNVRQRLLAENADSINTGSNIEKAAGARKYFQKYIDEATQYLNEVYYRYLFNDMKNAQVAKLYAEIKANAKLATEFLPKANSATVVAGGKNVANINMLGYADFFANGADTAALIEALEIFVTGASQTAVFEEKGDFAYLAGKEATLVNNIKNIGTDVKAAQIDREGVNCAAQAAYVEVLNAVEAVKDTIKDIAVKYYFLNYMDVAEDNLLMANYAYTTTKDFYDPTYALSNAIKTDYNGTMALITIEKYAHINGNLELENYFETYVEVLKEIVDCNDTHVLLTGKTFADMLKDVASSQVAAAKWADAKHPMDFAKIDFSAVTSADGYTLAGATVVKFDKYLNGNLNGNK